MSSFETPHFIYLFKMSNGKLKVAYGPNEDAAFENLRLRLTPAEIAPIIRENPLKVSQREFRNYIDQLG